MTTEQIKLFNEFLNEQNRFYAFYDCLQKVPIDLAFTRKETYLPRVSAVLALSYGFFQDRNINKIKTGEWRHLRNVWIERAAEANLLGEEFVGIEPESIVAALNSVFNQKQYRGSLSDCDKYTKAVAEEAAAIQDQRDLKKDVADDAEMIELRKIFEDNTVRTPAQVYNSDNLKQRVKAIVTTRFNECKFVGKKSRYGVQQARLGGVLGTYNVDEIEKEVSEMIVLCESMKAVIAASREDAKKEFNEGLLEYERYFLEWQDKQAKARGRYNELKIARLRVQPEPEAPVTVAAPSAPEAEQKPETAAPVTNPDEQVIVLRPSATAARRVSLSATQLSCTYNDTSNKSGVHYRITINSVISKRLIDAGTMNYHLVQRKDRLYLRFSAQYTPTQRVNVATKGNTCTICDKLLIEYLRKHFGITSRTMIINVALDKDEPEPNILCELQSAVAVSFQ